MLSLSVLKAILKICEKVEVHMVITSKTHTVNCKKTLATFRATLMYMYSYNILLYL